MACYKPYPLCHLPQLWLVRTASTCLHNQQSGRLPTTSASTLGRFSHHEDGGRMFLQNAVTNFKYLVWKPHKWLPYKAVYVQVMKAQLHIFLTAVPNGTISSMPQGFTLGTHLIGDWVGPKTGLDSLDKRKILFLSQELNHDSSVFKWGNSVVFYMINIHICT